MPDQNQGKLPGLPVDAFGEKSQDPTKNVLDLVKLVVERQDSLRDAESKRIDQRIEDREKESIQRWSSLKELIEEGLRSSEKAVGAALATQKEAVTKAENAAEKRFEGVNEFRATLSDQQARLMPRSEVEVVLKAQNEKIEAVQTRLDKSEGGKAGITQFIGYILFGITIIGFLITQLK